MARSIWIIFCTINIILGTLRINEMTDTSYNIQDEIQFTAINIRNLGSMYMNNGMDKHILTGNYLQVYPGGLLNAKNLQINAESVIVDVLGEVRADHNGYCTGGRSLKIYSFLFLQLLEVFKASCMRCAFNVYSDWLIWLSLYESNLSCLPDNCNSYKTPWWILIKLDTDVQHCRNIIPVLHVKVEITQLAYFKIAMFPK